MFTKTHKGSGNCKCCGGRFTFRVTGKHTPDCAELFADLVKAAAPAEAEAIQAQFSVALPGAAGALPSEIQWMPPGRHTINASQNGKAVTRTVSVTAEGAARVQAALVDMLAAADRGEDAKPYLDFNHEDRDASAWPVEFYWAGDDPKKGGIRAKLEWSDPGKGAVTGKSYRSFSPSFFLDAKGEVVGAPTNMGGLVNRPAFRRIAPISSKAGSGEPDADATAETTTEKNQPTMKSLLAILAKHGVIPSAEVEEASATSAVATYLAAQSALKTELDAVKAKLGTTETALVTAREAHAHSVVEAAVKAGRIEPKNDALKAKFKKLIADDPTNEDLLPEAKATPGKVVDVKTGDDPGATQAKANGESGAEHPFLAKAKEISHARKVSEADAMEAAGREHQDLYKDYRAKLFGR